MSNKDEIYTVGPEHLPGQSHTDQAVEFLQYILSSAAEDPEITEVSFTGEVYTDTDTPNRFQVLGYVGIVASIDTSIEPPSFSLIGVSDAWRRVAECACTDGRLDDIFDVYNHAENVARFSRVVDETFIDPNIEGTLLPDGEVTIRFDRLSGCSGFFSF